MGSPLVSVVIPTWNRAREVPEAIASVLAQSYRPIEVIVVDDGSTDETPAVLDSYGGAIRVIRQENAGVSAARNTGIRAAHGRFIAFLDSDDLWMPTKLERQVALMRAAGSRAVCCWGNSVEVWPDGREVNDFEFWRFRPTRRKGILLNPVEVFLTRFLLFTPTAVVDADFLTVAGLYDESLPVMEDHDLALRLGCLGPWAYTAEPLARVRRHTPHSLTTAAERDGAMLRACMVRIYEKMSADGRLLSGRERRLLKRNLAHARSDMARAAGGAPRSHAREWCSRLMSAAWRRSPWFPRPRTEALGCCVAPPPSAAEDAHPGAGAPPAATVRDE